MALYIDFPTEGVWEIAVVKWFDPVRLYGFLTIEGEKDMFFHYGDGRWPEIINGVAVFGKATKPFRVKGVVTQYLPLDKPTGGVHVLFMRGKGKEGKTKASPWVFDDDLWELTLLYHQEQKDKAWEESEEWDNDHDGPEWGTPYPKEADVVNGLPLETLNDLPESPYDEDTVEICVLCGRPRANHTDCDNCPGTFVNRP